MKEQVWFQLRVLKRPGKITQIFLLKDILTWLHRLRMKLFNLSREILIIIAIKWKVGIKESGKQLLI